MSDPAGASTRAVHAVLLGDRLMLDRASFSGALSTTPLCLRRAEGFVVAFRYGALVFVGLAADDEGAVTAELAPGAAQIMEEERLTIELKPDGDEGLIRTGVLQLKELDGPQVLVLADILAKSVALAHYEREIGGVFDTIEPAANTLAASGHLPRSRKELLALIGSALLAQHRVSGRIAFAEKPDILWERPELERLYARLEDEFEIIERGTLLGGKVTVLASVAGTFTDLIDATRSARLELLIVILILAELVIAIAALFRN
jgi:uncharacterized Rmd1/YagE family protein